VFFVCWPDCYCCLCFHRPGEVCTAAFSVPSRWCRDCWCRDCAGVGIVSDPRETSLGRVVLPFRFLTLSIHTRIFSMYFFGECFCIAGPVRNVDIYLVSCFRFPSMTVTYATNYKTWAGCFSSSETRRFWVGEYCTTLRRNTLWLMGHLA